MSRHTLKTELYLDDEQIPEGGDDVIEVELPAEYEVCHRCRGEGKHVNEAIDGNGLSAEDFAEDPDFKEDYFNGVYDVQCTVCKGLRVVLVVIEEAIPEEYKKLYEETMRIKGEVAAEEAYERRMREMGYQF